MPTHRFTSKRGRQLEVQDWGGTTKLFLVSPGETSGTGPRRLRLCDQPLPPPIVTALLQEIIVLQEPANPTKRAKLLREANKRIEAQGELLDELEWFGHKDGTREFCCLWCDRLQSQGHRKDCRWLAARGGEK